MPKNALLVIDVQQYYVNEHTAYLPERIERFIDTEKFDFVLFSKFVNHTKTNMFKTFRWGKMMTPEHTDICDNLRRFVHADNLFVKDTYSVFKAKGFREFLDANAISGLTICGFDTDACVLASAYDAFDLGYAVRVLGDLTDSHAGSECKRFGMAIIDKNIQVTGR